MRRKPGEAERVRQLIQQNVQRRLSEFKVQTMKCPECGGDLFELKRRFLIGYVPELVCQQPGGDYVKNPIDSFVCSKCGKELPPEEWEKAARDAFNNKQEKVLVPEDIKPEDNGKE